MTLNIKPIVIDLDDAITLSSAGNPTPSSLNFVRGNTYVLQANVYTNSSSTVVGVFDTGDAWSLYLGRVYESNASPVVAITNPANFNNTTDWSMANVQTGFISVKVNVSGTALDVDMSNDSSETYTLQLVVINNAGGEVMVCNTPAYIQNSVQP